MNNRIILIFLSFSLSAKIIKISNLDSIKEYLEPQALVLFDIHYTLLSPAERTDVKLMQPDASKLVDDLEKNYNVFALTKSPTHWNKHIFKQLKNVNISFEKKTKELNLTNECLKKVQFDKEICLTSFENGVIFSGPVNKGKALELFLKNYNFTKPSEIILVDDLYHNLRSVSNFAKKSNIKFIGLWYQAA